ncbi:hypothetical protein CISIN_1g0009121mg, partial [Citrus sinensis]
MFLPFYQKGCLN